MINYCNISEFEDYHTKTVISLFGGICCSTILQKTNISIISVYIKLSSYKSIHMFLDIVALSQF